MACHLFDELRPNDVSEKELDTAVRRVLRARVRQGHFNPLPDLPYADLDGSVFGRAAHRDTAREIAAKGSVLLKNEVGGAPRLWPGSVRVCAAAQ